MSEKPLEDDFPMVRLEVDTAPKGPGLGRATRRAIDDLAARIGQPGGARLRVLFHGPSGTGKTLAASLLGRAASRPVYRIDLSAIISKYIGETENNLDRVFDLGEEGNGFLFFVESDALFDRRTETRDANDRFANQQAAYLLQRIEQYRGVAILAVTTEAALKEIADRFDVTIRFPGAKDPD